MVVHGRNWSHPSTKLSLRCYFGTNYLRGDITVIDGGDADWLNGLRCYAQLMIIAVTQVRVWLTFTCTFHSLCNVSTGKCGQFEFSWSSRSISPSDGATSCNGIVTWTAPFDWRSIDAPAESIGLTSSAEREHKPLTNSQRSGRWWWTHQQQICRGDDWKKEATFGPDVAFWLDSNSRCILRYKWSVGFTHGSFRRQLQLIHHGISLYFGQRAASYFIATHRTFPSESHRQSPGDPHPIDVLTKAKWKTPTERKCALFTPFHQLEKSFKNLLMTIKIWKKSQWLSNVRFTDPEICMRFWSKLRA